MSPGGDPSPKPYLLDSSSQLTLDLQAEALDVPDEEFSVLTLQGQRSGGLAQESPTSATKAGPCSSLPSSPALMPPATT